MAKIYIHQAIGPATLVETLNGTVTILVKTRFIDPEDLDLNLHQLLAKHHPDVSEFWLWYYGTDEATGRRRIRYGIIEGEPT